MYSSIPLQASAKQPTTQLRKDLKAARAGLSAQQQRLAAVGVCRQIMRHPRFLRCRRIAAYLPNQGEVDLQPLIEQCWHLNKTVYLPVLHPFRDKHLAFMRYEPGQPLALNRYGIPEPIANHDSECAAWILDMVLTPLVGFDAQGHRMGMGGGYYDRTFAFMRDNWRFRQPLMLGVGHDCQEVERLPVNPWDIRMQGIVTGTRLIDAR